MGCASSSETSATTAERPDSSMRIANNQSSNGGATTEKQPQSPQRRVLTDEQLKTALELPELANPLVIGLPTTHDQPAAGGITSPHTLARPVESTPTKEQGFTRARAKSSTCPPTTAYAAAGPNDEAPKPNVLREAQSATSYDRPRATSHGSNALPRRHNSMSSPKLRPGKSPSSQSRIHHHHSGAAILDAAPAFLDRIASSLGSAPTPGLASVGSAPTPGLASVGSVPTPAFASGSRTSPALDFQTSLGESPRAVTNPTTPLATASASTPADGFGPAPGVPSLNTSASHGSPRTGGLARTLTCGLSRSRSSSGLNVTFAAVLRTDGTN